MSLFSGNFLRLLLVLGRLRFLDKRDIGNNLLANRMLDAFEQGKLTITKEGIEVIGPQVAWLDNVRAQELAHPFLGDLITPLDPVEVRAWSIPADGPVCPRRDRCLIDDTVTQASTDTVISTPLLWEYVMNIDPIIEVDLDIDRITRAEVESTITN